MDKKLEQLLHNTIARIDFNSFSPYKEIIVKVDIEKFFFIISNL